MRSDSFLSMGTIPSANAPQQRGLGMMMMVIGSSTMSFSGVVIRSVEVADAWQLNFYRAIAFVAVMLCVLLVQDRGAAFRKITHAGSPCWAGGFLLAGANMAFLISLANTTVANTLFTLSAIPFITAVMAWLFLKETLSRATLITMVFAAAGVGVMIADGIGGGSLYGNAMALLTAVLFSGFSVVVRRYRTIDMLPAALLSGVITIVVAGIVRFDALEIPLHDILMSFLWGGVLSGLANVLFIFASRHIVAAELTLFLLLEFSLGPVWVWLFIGEVPTDLTVVGGSLVISAVIVWSLIELRKSRQLLKRGRLGPM